MTTLRALILAARLDDDELSLIAGGRPPQALPVANVPLVVHALRAAAGCGAREATVVVTAATAREVRAAAAGEGPAGLELRWAELDGEPTYAEGVRAAAETLTAAGEDAPLLVLRADGVLSRPVAPLVADFLRMRPDALVAVHQAAPQPPSDVVPIDRGRLLRLADGASAPPPPSGECAGAQLLGPRAVELACELVGSPREGQTIEALLAALAEADGSVEVRSLPGAWTYTGSVDGLLDANRLVLDALPGEAVEADLSRARVEGRVAIHRTAVLDRTTVRGPAIVGPGAVLVDAFVGPYTAIGAGVRLEGAEVEHSIVLERAVVRHPGKRLESSLIGRDAVVTREFALPAALRLRIGNRAEISLS